MCRSSDYLLVMLFLITSSCSKKDIVDTSNDVIITADISSAEIFPAIASTAIGRVSGAYNIATTKMVYNVTWQNISGSAVSCGFCAPASIDGREVEEMIQPAVIQNEKYGLAAGEFYLSHAQAAELMAGKWSFIIKTSSYPDGELRGKISVPN